MGTAPVGDFSALLDDYAARKEYSERLISYVLSQLLCRPGDRILDIGCGTGKATRRLAAPWRLVIGVDPDGKAIQKAQDLGGMDIAYRRALTPALPFSAGYFAGITTFCSFHWWYDQAGALDEVHRVLQSQRYFVIAGYDDLGSFHEEVRSVVARFADKEIARPKLSYDPMRILGRDGRWSVGERQWEQTDEFTLEDLIRQIRSMAPWNAVATDRREDASAAMVAHFQPQLQGGVFRRPLRMRVVTAQKA